MWSIILSDLDGEIVQGVGVLSGNGVGGGVVVVMYHAFLDVILFSDDI